MLAYSICNFLQALLLNQKQEVEEARKSLIEADARNADLMKKYEDAEKRADQFQESTQRCVFKILGSLISKEFCANTFI